MADRERVGRPNPEAPSGIRSHEGAAKDAADRPTWDWARPENAASPSRGRLTTVIQGSPSDKMPATPVLALTSEG